MPVPIAPVDWQVRSALGEFALQCGEEIPVVIVDRSLSLEVVIMLGDREKALPWDILSAQDIFQKRNDVFVFLWPAEGE
jgi:hypothetical protein